MPKKRKAEANGLDEMDRQLYGTFRTAANSISALYTSSLSLQKRAFNAGARHATERLLAWALSHGEGQLSAADLAAALQAELVVLEGEDAALQAAADGVGGGVDQPHGGGADHPGHAAQQQQQHHHAHQPRGGRNASTTARCQLATIDVNATTHGDHQSSLGQKLGQAFTTAGGPVTRSGGGGGGGGGGGHHHHHHPTGDRHHHHANLGHESMDDE
jgi:hypothetical protein